MPIPRTWGPGSGLRSSLEVLEQKKVRKAGVLTLQGQRAAAQKIRLLALAADKQALRAIEKQAKKIMADSKKNYVPVDETDLKKSGRVTEGYYFGTKARVEMWYGGGKSAPYALAVHEHFSTSYSPYSWKMAKKPVKFKPLGHGPKYLEIPLRKAALTMPHEIAKYMNVETLAQMRTNYGGRDPFGRFGSGDVPSDSYSLGDGNTGGMLVDEGGE